MKRNRDLSEEIMRVERIKGAIDAWWEQKKKEVKERYGKDTTAYRSEILSFWDKYSLFTFLYHQGVRIGEALSLTWEDVNLEGTPPTANIVQLKKKVRQKRIIPLHREVVKVLMEGKDIMGEVRGKIWPRSVRAYQKWFRTNWDIHPHLLRHACTVRLMKKTHGNLEVVRRILGHANYSTLKRYADLSIVDLWEDLNR